MKTKQRHQKLFSDKFESKKLLDEDILISKLQQYFKNNRKIEEKVKSSAIRNTDLKKILVDINLYSGTLYMDVGILEKYTNIEAIYVELVKINQTNNTPPYYKKNCNNCFIKIFVLEYNKEKEIARVALIDKDNFSYKFSIINLPTNNLYIENGVIKTIL